MATELQHVPEHSFSEVLICRCPKTLSDALEQAAANELITKAAYARRAVMSALRRDGFLSDDRRAP
jgi:hypothetical protein